MTGSSRSREELERAIASLEARLGELHCETRQAEKLLDRLRMELKEVDAYESTTQC